MLLLLLRSFLFLLFVDSFRSLGRPPPPPEYLKTSVLQCLGWAQGDLGRFRTCAHVAGSWADCSTRVAPSVSIEVDCPPLI